MDLKQKKKRSALKTPPHTALPSYKTPPVSEVAIGVFFNSLPALKIIPHIGALWQKFRKDYPRAEHAIPIELKGNIEIDDVTGLPLPRVWFIDDTESKLIQVQSNFFCFNWRRHQNENAVYPHYDAIAKEFRSNLAIFQQFLSEMGFGNLEPTELELTYINHIPQGSGWETIDEVSKVVTDLCWNAAAPRFLPKPSNLAWHAAFSLPDRAGRLRIKLNEAKRKVDAHPLIVLELSAKGIGEDNSIESIWDWYSIAHEWIVRGFTDLTTEEMQFSHWGRNDVARS